MKEKLKKRLIKKKVLEVVKLSKEVYPPESIFETDVGLDLRANETINLKPLDQKVVNTGLIIKIPENHVGLIRDRAGIVSKMKVHTIAGTFDSAYRGEVSVLLINFGDKEIQIEKGMRIAQLIVIPITKVKVKLVKRLSSTKRGSSGFGSTGIK